MKESIYKPGADCQISNLAEVYDFVFGALRNGKFIEIGAFDGEAVSNTCFLADLGWEGIYVEAVQEYAMQCQIRHLKNRVKVLPCAIGAEVGMVEISVGIMVSTTRPDHVELFNSFEWSKGHHKGDIRRVPCLDTSTLIERIGISSCDLLVIDVEGVEPLIIRDWDFSKLRPTLIIVETRDRDEQFPERVREEYKEMLEIIGSNGYKLIQHDGCNALLVSLGGKPSHREGLLIL